MGHLLEVKKNRNDKRQNGQIGFHRYKMVELRKRDLLMMELANDMKFISPREANELFFHAKVEGAVRPYSAAKNRLASLKSVGLFESERSHKFAETFYRVTANGVQLLEDYNPNRIPCPPLGTIDLNNFDHDYRVLQTRVFLQKHKVIESWISERQLRFEPGVESGLKPEFYPDGLMVLTNGEKVAFEFENSPKNKETYRKKVEKLMDYMSYQEKPVFNKVHFVCVRPNVLNILRNCTKQYGETFQVDSIDEFMGRCLAGQEELRIQGTEILSRGLVW